MIPCVITALIECASVCVAGVTEMVLKDWLHHCPTSVQIFYFIHLFYIFFAVTLQFCNNGL